MCTVLHSKKIKLLQELNSWLSLENDSNVKAKPTVGNSYQSALCLPDEVVLHGLFHKYSEYLPRASKNTAGL